jgi:hypothetical protein
MSPITSKFRRIAYLPAVLLLCSGVAVSAATTASAATGTRQATTAHQSAKSPAATTRTYTAVQAVKLASSSASSGLTLTNPGPQQTEPGTAATLAIGYTDTDPSATVTFSAVNLAPGLSINPSTGVISGTTGSHSYNSTVGVSATDSDGSTATIMFIWRVSNVITVSVPASTQAYVGTPASIALSATDSAPDSTFTYSSEFALPAGLSLNPSTGVISGTPTTVGETGVTIMVTDASRSSGMASFNIDVGGNITLGGLTAQKTVAGQAVGFSFTGSETGNGTPYYLLKNLPPGLSISNKYYPLITGWPTTPGIYDVTVTATDGDGGTTSGSFTWTVTSPSDSGPTGAVHLNLDGKCLDDRGGSTSNGNTIDIWSCNGTTSQKWTYAEDGTLRVNGKCLDIVNAGTAAGDKVQLWGCNGRTSQQWVVGTDTELVNSASGLCLDDAHESTTNGTQADIWPCGAAGWREWTLPAGAVQSAIAGRCLDDYQASTANGAIVDAYTCDGTVAQKWTTEANGSIEVNGKCLDDTGDGAAVGTKIDLWSCWGGASQKWTVTTAKDSLGVELQHGSLCVSPADIGSNNSAQLTLEACGTNESYWHAW